MLSCELPVAYPCKVKNNKDRVECNHITLQEIMETHKHTVSNGFPSAAIPRDFKPCTLYAENQTSRPWGWPPFTMQGRGLLVWQAEGCWGHLACQHSTFKAVRGQMLGHEFPTPRPHHDSLMRQKAAFRDTYKDTHRHNCIYTWTGWWKRTQKQTGWDKKRELLARKRCWDL